MRGFGCEMASVWKRWETGKNDLVAALTGSLPAYKLIAWPDAFFQPGCSILANDRSPPGELFHAPAVHFR